MTISLRLFLEKLAILLIFADKDESSTDPIMATFGKKNNRAKDLIGVCVVNVGHALKDLDNKKALVLTKASFNMAPQPGLEPGTHGLTVRCSTN